MKTNIFKVSALSSQIFFIIYRYLGQKGYSFSAAGLPKTTNGFPQNLDGAWDKEQALHFAQDPWLESDFYLGLL